MTLPSGQSGTPDYGRSLSSNPTIQSYEAGEDATRLLMGGGANSRSGRWLWATGFESSLAEFIGSLDVTLDSATAYQGAKSAKLPTIAVIGNASSIQKILFVPRQADADDVKIGMESMNAFDFVVGRSYDYEWRITTPGGVNLNNQFYIRLITDGTNTNLYYMNSAGVNVLLANITNYVTNPFTSYLKQFHFTKLVVDIKNNVIVSFSFDNLYFPIGANARLGVATTLPTDSVVFSEQIIARSAHVHAVYTDNWILTSDEP